MEDQTQAPEVTPEVTPEAKPESDPLMAELSDSQPAEEAEDKSEDKPAEDTEQKEDESETEGKPEPEQPAGELTPEEAQKEEARRRYEEREKIRAERRERVSKQTQEYIDESEDDTERRIRTIEADKYNSLIEQTEDKLLVEFDRAKANPDLQIFNPDNKEAFNPRLYEKAIRDFEAGYIQFDANGEMVGLKGSLLQYLTETAEIYQAAINSGQIQQVRAERKMKTNADTKPAATPKAPTKDLLTEALSSDD